jgi:hypothetical protein
LYKLQPEFGGDMKRAKLFLPALSLLVALSVVADEPRASIPDEFVGKFQGTWHWPQNAHTYLERGFTLEVKADGSGTYCWEKAGDSPKGCSPIIAKPTSKGLIIKYNSKAATIKVEKGKAFWHHPENRWPLESYLKRE